MTAKRNSAQKRLFIEHMNSGSKEMTKTLAFPDISTVLEVLLFQFIKISYPRKNLRTISISSLK